MDQSLSIVESEKTYDIEDKDNDLTNAKNFNELVMGSRSYFTRLIYKAVEVLTNILSTSKGRNKVCSLIQYHAKLIYSCHSNSNIPEVAEFVM